MSHGCIDIKSGQLCPLVSLHIRSIFVDRFGSIDVVQEYENPGATPIEAVFTFPKDDQAAITGFKVKINDKTLIGQIESSDEAQEKYSDAIAEGKGAYLLSQKRSDIVTLYIGSLLPKQKVQVEITCATEAQWEGDSLRITFPTTIAPRYTPEQFQRDEEYQINPAYHSNDNTLPYDFEFESLVQLTHDKISSFESPTHKFSEIDISPVGNEVTARVKATKGDIVADRDIVLIVNTKNNSLQKRPVMIDEVDEDGHHALYLSFIPKIVCNEISKKIMHEIVFLIDRSGSMDGQQMVCAKEALQLFLRSLPSCYFDIVSFGSNYSQLFGNPTLYSNESLSKATKEINKFSADLGGTEILAPLKKIYSRSPTGGKRIIFILTDGQVSNTRQVVDLVKQNSATTSVYALGIGSSVSRDLVNGVSQAGNGYAEYATANERLQPKIIRQLKRALENFSVQIDWHSNKVEQFPERISPITDEDPLHVMAFVDDTYLLKNKSIEIKITSNNSQEYSIAFDLSQMKTVRGKRIHQLFAKKKADAMVSKDKNQIRNLQILCKKYHVLSSVTSFVLVEPRKEAATTSPELVNVPLARPKPPRATAQTLVTNGTVSFGGKFSNSYKATIGADFEMCRVLVNNREIKVQLWDLAGAERFGHHLSRAFASGTSAVVLMYSVASRSSFDNVKTWMDSLTEQIGSDIPMVLAGNKIDCEGEVSTKEGEALAASLGIPFFEISVKDTTNLGDLAKLLFVNMIFKQPDSALCKDSGVGKTSFNRRMVGSTIDLGECNLPISTISSQSTIAHQHQSNTSVLGKVWQGFKSVVGYFSKSGSAVPNTPVTSNTNTNNNNANIPMSQQIQQYKPQVSNQISAIILAQNAEGAFIIDAAQSIQFFGGNYTTQIPQGATLDVWMTIFCVTYLTVKCGQHKSEWELIVQKAENWLKSVGGNKPEWKQRARQLVQQNI